MSTLNILIITLSTLTAYLIGSIPTGVLVTRFFTGGDIRKLGSGNIGATNVRRVAGNRLGAVVLLGDLLKGFFPVFLVVHLTLFPDKGLPWATWVGLTTLGAFLGHLYPAYSKGRGGGKGVATAAGCFLAISPAISGGAFIVFILVLWRRRTVSPASLAAAATLPVFTWFQTGLTIFTILAVVVAVFIFFRHSGNIRRLREGTEPKI